MTPGYDPPHSGAPTRGGSDPDRFGAPYRGDRDSGSHRDERDTGSFRAGERDTGSFRTSDTERLRSGPTTSSFAPVGPPTSGFPSSGGPPTSGFPTVPPAYGPPGYPPDGYRPSPPRPRRSVLGIVALVLAVLLMIVAGVEGYLLKQANDRIAAAEKKAAQTKSDTDARVGGLEQRTKELEKQAGNTLDPAAVAAGVLPSVFRVIAGEFTGTAFAFGNAAEGGGTNLLTNHHVIEQVYNSGRREVDLEQKNRRYKARIVRVDAKVDLALLVATEDFPKLAPSPEPAKPGQPVVVVGAPLGLDDSVTSGVVSALRTVAGTSVLQFDAAVNPGNSGGPVINAQKQVVGVVNAKLRDAEGISLGIPVAVVCSTFGLC